MSLVKSVEDFLSLHNSSIRSASCWVSWCEPRINQSQSKITLWTAMIIGVSFYESPPTAVLVCADFLQSLSAPWYLFATYFRLFALSFRIFCKRRWQRLNIGMHIMILHFVGSLFARHFILFAGFWLTFLSLCNLPHIFSICEVHVLLFSQQECTMHISCSTYV